MSAFTKTLSRSIRLINQSSLTAPTVRNLTPLQRRTFIPGLSGINPEQIKKIQEQVSQNPAAQAALLKLTEYIKTKYTLDPSKPPGMAELMKMARDSTLISLTKEFQAALQGQPTTGSSATVEEPKVIADESRAKKEEASPSSSSWFPRNLFGSKSK